MQIFFQQATTNSPLLALISLLQLFVHFTSLSPVVLAPSSYLHTFFPLFLKQVWLEKHLQILYYKAFQSSSNQNAQYFSVFSELILVLEVFTDWGWGGVGGVEHMLNHKIGGLKEPEKLSDQHCSSEEVFSL